MAEHECIVGLLNNCETPELATVSAVREYVADSVRYNQQLKDMGIVSVWLYRKEWALKDYADKRKSTNLTRFDFCPECGKRIDWAAIRKEDTNG